jgi:uncharacterized membrane protein
VAGAHRHAVPPQPERAAIDRAGAERPAHDPTAHREGEHSHAGMLRRWIWRDFANVLLGVWLIASTATFGYREAAMAASDAITGLVIVVLAALTLSPRFDLARWGLCLAGIWLLLAPLVFWTRDAGAYGNDTIVGALVIAFSVLLPMMPSRAHHELMTTPGPDTPPGWSYNPSDWFQRGPIIAMAFVGFFLSRYLSAYQLGHVPYPWDPVFGDGTRRVLDSEVSKAWPVSDAGLGAVSYLLEALSGLMGGRNRWRTMPWMVLMFGVLVVPLGVVSIVLVILQPVAVGAWCTLCLVTAAAMLIMVAPAVDEVVAMGQFLAAARREGQPLWHTFWVGGTLRQCETAATVESQEGAHRPPRSVAAAIVAAFELNNVPWTLIVSAALGVWLMAAPAVFGGTGAAADNDHLAGALVVTWAVIGFGEVTRPVRLLNIPIGAWIAIAPWLISGATRSSAGVDVLAGLALVALSIKRGHIEQRFGGWSRWLV